MSLRERILNWLKDEEPQRPPEAPLAETATAARTAVAAVQAGAWPLRFAWGPGLESGFLPPARMRAGGE